LNGLNIPANVVQGLFAKVRFFEMAGFFGFERRFEGMSRRNFWDPFEMGGNSLGETLER
jgi:hypothetical protein